MINLKNQIPFPFIDELSPSSYSELQKSLKKHSYRKGQIAVQKGQKIDGVYIVKSGSLRIFALALNGIEKPIDYLGVGEICVFSINCALNQLVFPAWLTIDSNNADILIIPPATFRRLYKNEPCIREFIFEAMSKRIYSMMSIFEETMAYDIGSRINNFLVRTCCENKTIKISQQDIANRLGTAREVVSRHLKDLENLGLVKLSRMKIYIISPQNLAKIPPKRAM